MHCSPPISPIHGIFNIFFILNYETEVCFYQVEWALRSWWERSFSLRRDMGLHKMNVFWLCLWNLATLKLICLCNHSFFFFFFFFKEFCSFSVPYIFSSSLGRFIVLFRMGMTFGISCVQQEKIYLWIVINTIPVLLYIL